MCSGSMARKIEISEDPTLCVVEDMIYVAVGNVVKECKAILVWALQNSGGRRICILHVHQPAQLIPFMGTRAPASSLKEGIVKEYREDERQHKHKILEEYLRICRQTGVEASKIVIEMDSIEKGIVELISQQGIRMLVMGAAAEKHYKRKMMDLRSGKAKYVRQHALVFCQVQFICKGLLIFTRKASADNETREFNQKRSRSVAERPSGGIHGIELSNYGRSRSVIVDKTRSSSGMSKLNIPFREGTESSSSPKSMLEIEGSSDERDGLPGSPTDFRCSTCSPNRGFDLTMTSLKDEENELTFSIHSPALGYARSPSTVKISSPLQQPSPTLTSGASSISASSSSGALNSVDGTLEVTTLRGKFRAAEGEIEVLYGAHKELIRKITEAALAKERELEGTIRIQRNQLRDNLRSSNEQETLLKSQITELQNMVNELKVERDTLLMEAQELRRKQEGSTENMPEFFVFSLSDIKEATQNFSRTLKIGHGGFGEIYRGKINQVEVAIKMPHPPGTHSHDAQAPQQFQMEVVVLSRLRHPNLVKLIGCCPEVLALVYEYLPNGSLEDRLNCRGNSPPLSWEARMRIATELCSVLIYLHSVKPQSIVHGDLKPSNILLDANFACKLGDFGICRMLVPDTSSSDGRTLFRITDPKGTIPYADPEFQETGVLTLESDIYAFGIILLQLLTRIEPRSVANEVKCSLKTGNLESLLDASAGDWPVNRAQELAQLGLRCCNRNRKWRPKLESHVWKVLEMITASYAASSSSQARP